MIGDDACFMVDRYLDDAYIAQIYSVTVIHGKGTGILRNAVHFCAPAVRKTGELSCTQVEKSLEKR